MLTKILSLNEYRTNIAKFWKQGKEENIKYVVLVHSKPAFEVIPLSDDFMINDTEEVPLDFHELEDWEITPELLKEIEISKSKPLSSFRNL